MEAQIRRVTNGWTVTYHDASNDHQIAIFTAIDDALKRVAEIVEDPEERRVLEIRFGDWPKD